MANRHAAGARGWNNTGHYVCAYPRAENPPRQGCRWNDKECFDLVDEYTAGASVWRLARLHQRTRSAINSHLERALVGAEKYMLNTQQSSGGGGEPLISATAVPTPADGDLRVWWVAQLPGPAFHVPVPDLLQARLILGTLARYDHFQLENKIKPDYCNVGGLEMFDRGEWCEWEGADGDDIDSIELPAVV